MTTYKIIGADGKEYGPITADTLKQWMAQGRVNGETKVLPEGGTEWIRVAEIPELATASPTANPVPPVATPAGEGGSPLPTDVGERDYDLDLGGCLARAWALVTGPQMWLVIGGVAIWLLIQIGVSGLAAIPLIGLLFSLASLIFGGPLMGGVYYFLLRCLRGQPAEVVKIFDGFRSQLGQLIVGQLVVVILTCLAILPGLGLVTAGIFPLFMDRGIEGIGIALIALGVVTILVPAVYLSVSWFFTLPLILDKRLDFWPAMQLSRRVVGRHWWTLLLATIFMGLLCAVGMLLCCIGTFFTVPLALAFAMCCYERMFSPATGDTVQTPS